MPTGLHVAGSVPQQHRVGDYVLRKWLAQGGMAELYIARPADPARASEVAVVKRVLPQFAQDAQFVRMFAREAQLASALKHPNIVDVYGAGGVGTQDCYLAMEYVHGVDLSEVLRLLRDTSQAIPLAQALSIVIGISAGLHHAHELKDDDKKLLGIVHRDVSPSNVLLSYEGGVKITDFGVAKALALTSFTQAGTRKGKLSYMSPEQAVADPVDRRADVFAIGAVLFELTTMQRMFGGENELAVMHKLLFRERPRPSQLLSNYPPELEGVVLRAVAQKPEDRYQHAQLLQQALEAFAAKRGLDLSPEALGRWLASIIPPKPHPTADPEFFADPSAETPLGGHEDTVADAVGPGTLADGNAARHIPTGLERVAPPPAQAGHLLAAESRNDMAMRPSAAAPLAPHGAVIVNPAAPHPSATPAPTTVPVVPQAYRATTNVSPSKPPSVFVPIVAGAVLLSAVGLGAAFLYAAQRDLAADEAPATQDATPPADAAAVPAAAPEPDENADAPEPAPAPDPVAQPPTPAPADDVAEPAPAGEPATPEAAAGDDPAPADEDVSPKAKKDKGKGKRDKGKRDKGKKGKGKGKGSDSGASDVKSPPPPPPPPPGKKRSPTDTLLPGM